MKPREFSYGGMFVRRAPYVIACVCMLALAAASAWLTANAVDEHTRATGLRYLIASIVLFALIAVTPFFIRRALVVRIDSWGVSIPGRGGPENKNGLPWEQIADVRVLRGGKRDAVVLVPHNTAYLNPLMQPFGAFLLPPVNVSPDELKSAIEDYRAAVRVP